MKIYGHFKDIDDNTIYVEIVNADYNAFDIDIDSSNKVAFSEDPVQITTEVEDSFSPIIRRSATVSLVTNIYLGNALYAQNAESVIINIFKNNECIFAGFVAPNIYSQGYSNEFEEIQINCIDYLSILENKSPLDDSDYNTLRQQAQLRSFKYYFDYIFKTMTTMIAANMPNVEYMEMNEWVETGFVKRGEDYYVVETKINVINSDTAMTSGETRIGHILEKTYIQGKPDDLTYVGNVAHYKNYIWVTINNKLVNTGDFVAGALAETTTVVSSTDKVTGWTSTAPFVYYEVITTEYNMSDGTTTTSGTSKRGDLIPLKPDTTQAGSYYEYRRGSDSDLIAEVYEEGDTDTVYYYKDYAWVYCNGKWSLTTDYKKGDEFIDEAEPDDGQ